MYLWAYFYRSLSGWAGRVSEMQGGTLLDLSRAVGMTPSEPTFRQKKILDSLVGLPFVCLSTNQAHGRRIVAALRNGTQVRAEYAEEVFNAALMFDAMDGTGAYRRTVANQAQLEVLAVAERLYGCTVEVALVKWLAMPRVSDLVGTGYQNWGDRPRVVWPKATPHVN